MDEFEQEKSRASNVRFAIAALLILVLIVGYPTLLHWMQGRHREAGQPSRNGTTSPPNTNRDASGKVASKDSASKDSASKDSANKDSATGKTPNLHEAPANVSSLGSKRNDPQTDQKTVPLFSVAKPTVTGAKNVRLGSVDGWSASPYRYQLLLDAEQATISSLSVADFADRVRSLFDYREFEPRPMPLLGTAQEIARSGKRGLVESFRLTRLTVDGQEVPLPSDGGGWKLVGRSAPDARAMAARFQLTIERRGDKPFAVEKTYIVRPRHLPDATPNDEADLLTVIWTVSFPENTPHKVELDFLGPVGVPEENAHDVRRVIWGRRKEQIRDTKPHYLDFGELNKRYDAGTVVTIPETLDAEKGETPENIWYVGVSNRFFAAVVIPSRLRGEKNLAPEDVPSSEWRAITIRRLRIAHEPLSERGDLPYFVPVFRAGSDSVSSSWQASYDVYVGPKTSAAFAAVERAVNADLQLDDQIEYAQFGCCPSSLGCNDLIGGLIGKPLLRLLDGIYSLIPNYGVAIIVMVLLVRVVVYPISKQGTLSMLRMKELQPKLAEIQAKYANDQTKLGEEQMRLYQKEGINPIGGCLPMLLQMPIWIGLWGALSAAVNLRHAPFFGWMGDLAGEDALLHLSEPVVIPLPFCSPMSLPTALNVLPLLTALAMFGQQQMMTPASTPTPTTADGKEPVNPNPIDPKLMGYMMSGMFLVMLYSAPAALNLYIMTSMVFGFLENWWVKRQYEDMKARGLLTPSDKPGWFMTLVNKVRELQMENEKRKPIVKSGTEDSSIHRGKKGNK